MIVIEKKLKKLSVKCKPFGTEEWVNDLTSMIKQVEIAAEERYVVQLINCSNFGAR